MDLEISDSLDLGGYTVGELQDDASISSAGVVSGELQYITEYDSFDEGEDSGNYLAIHADIAPIVGFDYDIAVTSGDNQVVNFGKVFVIHVTDKDSQTVTVVASATGQTSVTKTLSLPGLTCLNA